MRNTRIHLIYLAIIGFFAYQYWANLKSEKASNMLNEEVGQYLKLEENVTKESTENLIGTISKNVKAYPSPVNLNYQLKTQEIYKKTLELTQQIGRMKKESTISEQNIDDLKKGINQWQNLLFVYDSTQQKKLNEKYLTKKLLENTLFWQKKKDNPLQQTQIYLTLTQKQIEMDRLTILNYYSNQIGGNDIVCNFGIGIVVAPNKFSWFEGDTFEADIYAVEHIKPFINEITFFVNGKGLKVHDEVAHFVDSNLTAGKKKIKVELRLKNSLTGEYASFWKEFEYEVLPKCAKNCQ
jgi:cell division protein FtsB